MPADLGGHASVKNSSPGREGPLRGDERGPGQIRRGTRRPARTTIGLQLPDDAVERRAVHDRALPADRTRIDAQHPVEPYLAGAQLGVPRAGADVEPAAPPPGPPIAAPWPDPVAIGAAARADSRGGCRDNGKAAAEAQSIDQDTQHFRL